MVAAFEESVVEHRARGSRFFRFALWELVGLLIALGGIRRCHPRPERARLAANATTRC